MTALSKEMKRYVDLLSAGLQVDTIYIGGGTPSMLPSYAWEKLLSLLNETFDLSQIREATVEANPSSLTEELLSIWHSSFFTRVSLGVQSFNDCELKTLGRTHNAKSAISVLKLLRYWGFDCSADLIFGIPWQTLRSWHNSLSEALASGVSHISTYQLTLEPDTPMGRYSPALPDGYPFYRFAQWYLPLKGFPQYEISSFAIPVHESLHNITYWRQGNVIALGPAAWGYIDGLRYSNPSTLEEYLNSAELGFPDLMKQGELLTSEDSGIEAAILALRTKWGITKSSFAAAWGEELLNLIINTLSERIPQSDVIFQDDSIALTPKGMRVGNAIWTELLLAYEAKP